MLSSWRACTPEGRRGRSVSGAVRQEPTRMSPHAAASVDLDEPSSRRDGLPWGRRIIPLQPYDSVAACELRSDFLVIWRSSKKKATETCGKTRDHASGSRIQSGPLRANRRIQSNFRSSSNYPIWRSRPSSRWRGSLIATSQSGRGQEATTSTANLRSTVGVDQWGTKCVSRTFACQMSPRTLAPLCPSLDSLCHCVAIAGNTCRPFARPVLLVPIPDQAQYALGRVPQTPHIASIGFDEVFCSRVSLAQ